MPNLLNPCLYIGINAHIFKIPKLYASVVLLFLFNFYTNAQVSFPNAEGFGKNATGGRGGNVYTVTNLNDEGSGSFREACEASGPRTIVFAVSGIINLESDIVINNDNLTIAGQTAPGDGICIKGAGFIVRASDVIVRYLRFRLGDNGYKDENGNVVGSNSSDSDTVGVYGSSGGTTDVIFDHCSLSWSIDEIVGIYGNPSSATNGVNNITFQYCIFSEALSASHHDEGSHSMAFLMNQNSNNITIYKNLFANSRERHIRSGGGCSFEMINNVVYNFRYTCVVSAESEFSMINNHYKEGNEPISSSYIADYTSQTGFDPELTRAYIIGNTSDAGLNQIDPAFNPYIESTPPLNSNITPENNASSIEDVLQNSGATLPVRDVVDTRVVNTYSSNSGDIIDTQEEVGSYPIYNSTAASLDTDSDGMPDFWEIENGLDINDPSDRNIVQPDGYTNLEYYINGISFAYQVNAGEDVTICEGESVTLTASGVESYLWNTGQDTASISISPNVTTTYTVTGIDSSGGTTTDDVTVFVNALPNANAGDDIAICEGESTTLSASGGGTYLWSTGQTTQNINVSPNNTTTYTVTVIQNNCEATDDVVVSVNALPIADAGNDVTINEGDSTTLTASGGGTYLWSTGETTQSIIVSPNSETTYEVTVTLNTCEANDNVTVFVNGPVVADAGEDVTICEGESTILTASGGDSYLWSTGQTTQSITVNPSINTTYSVTVSNDFSEDSDDVIVFVNPTPQANAGEDVSICEGETVTLTASGSDSYLWSTGETTSSINVNPNVTTTYTVTAIENNCESTDDVIVTVNPTPVADAGSDMVILEGDSITLTASGGGTYLWSTGQVTQSITVSPLVTTTYTVLVTVNNCQDQDEITIIVTDEVIVDAGEDETICEGESVVLTATGGNFYTWSTGETTQSITVNPNQDTTYTVTAFVGVAESDTDEVTVFVNPVPIADAGNNVEINEGENTTLTASGGDAYEWSTGETTQSIEVSPNETTTYTVFVYLNGCEDFDEVTVTVNQVVNANAGEDVTICEGVSTILTASGGDSYEWSTGETSQSITVNPTQNTTYSVTAYIGNGSDTDEVTVFVNPIPIANAGNNVEINEGESATLTASGGDSYEWNTGETTQSVAVSPNETTTYTVFVYLDGCEDFDDVIVTVNEIVNANAGEDVTICEGTSTTLTATGGDTYEWSTGETTQSITVNPNQETTYTVTAFVGNASGSDNVTVFVNPIPIADAGDNVEIYLGESTTLTASGGDSYEWNTGETTQSIIVNPYETMTFTVFVYLNGCEDFDEVTVTVNEAVNANAGEDVAICEGESTILTATGGINYLWNTGETTQSITVSPTATSNYTVIVSDENTSDTDQVTVFVNALPNVQISGNLTILEGEFTTLSATGANSYMWSNGASQPNIAVSPEVTTAYTVEGFINDCSSISEVIVNVLETVNASAGEDESICFGNSITLTASGGDSFIWNTGETTQSITVSPSENTTYTVIVSNELDSDAAEVTVLVENCDIDLPGEDDIVEDYEYSLYTDRFNPAIINVKLSGIEGISMLYIHDVTGKLIQTFAIEDTQGQSQEIQVNTAFYSKGIYVFTLEEQQKITPKQIVIR